MNRDPFEVLGISSSATEDEIKDAYRKLAKLYHPDLHPGDRQAEEKMKEINEAYSEAMQYKKTGSYSSGAYSSGGRSAGSGEMTGAVTGEELMKMNDTEIVKQFLADTDSLITPTEEQLAWFEKTMRAGEEESLQ